MSKQIGLKVTLSNLIRGQEPDSMLVDCPTVDNFLVQWRLHLDNHVLTRENWKDHADVFSRVLSVSLRNARLHDFDMPNDDDLSNSGLRAAIVLSIKALVRAFYRILLQLRSFRNSKVVYRLHFENSDYFSALVKPVRLLYHHGLPNQSPPSATLASRFLEDHGWCPKQIQHLLLNEDLETLYMAAALRGTSRTGFQHDRCTECEGCVAPSDFTPHHVEHGCTCAVVRPDMVDVKSIIAGGGIPVIEIRRTEELQWSLKVKSAEAQTDYTAISHVWMDGFADQNTNGLLTCQLSKIVQDVQLIKKERPIFPGHFPTDHKRPDFAEAITRGNDGPVTIWMDALCIPCADRNARGTSLALKKRAIDLMSPTYAGASEVLVIDKDIEVLDYTEHSDVKKYSLFQRVNFTPWMWRSWTLQEGALARRLYVRTAKFPEHVDHLRLPLKPRVWERRFVTSLNRLSRWIYPYHRDNLFLIITDSLRREIPASSIGRLEHPEYEMEEPNPLPDPEPRRLAALEKAVLHDQGVLFDANAFGYTVINTEGCPPQKFRISVPDHTYWIRLDRDLDLINGPPHTEARSLFAKKNHIILLPKAQEKLDAQGTVGRGISLAQLGKTRSLPVPPTLAQFTDAPVWQATPSRFNSGFTCGVITKLTPKPYTDAPELRGVLVQANAGAMPSPASTFLIAMDTTSWPVLQNVRTELFFEPNHKYVTGLGIVTFLLFAIGIRHLRASSFHSSVGSGIPLLAALGLVSWLHLIELNVSVGSALERRIRHRRWARTFYPTTPEMRAKYASPGFRFRTKVVDICYRVFLLDPVIQICGYLARSAERLREKAGRH